MKEKTKSSPVLMRIRENLKAEKRLFLALLIMYMISLPLYTIVEELCYKIRKMYDYNEQFYEHKFIFTIESFLEFSPVIIFVAVLEGIVVAMSVFKYLSKRTEVDKVFSLPLSWAQRFKADFISGLIIYIVPYIISFVIALVARTIVDLNSGTSTITYYDILGSEFTMWFYLFFIKLMFYAFCVFSCVCCGNAVQTFTGIVILNIAVPVCSYIPVWAIGQNVPGYHPSEMLELLKCTSPIGCMFAYDKIANSFVYQESIILAEAGVYGKYEFITWLFSCIFVIVAIVFISAWLYKKRKAEDTGKSFAFSLFFYILSGMAVMAIFSYFCVEKFYIVGTVLSVLAFIVLEIMKNKGFMEIKKFLLSMVYCVSVIGVVFVFIITGKNTGMFGKMKKIPDISDVRMISMGYVYFMGTASSAVFDEEESKSLLIDFNREIVEYCYSDNYDASDLNNSIVFTYMDNKGKVTERMYYVSMDMCDEFIYKLADINEYRNEICQRFNNAIDEYRKNNKGCTLVKTFDDTIENYSYATLNLGDETVEKLKESFYDDVMSAQSDEIAYPQKICYEVENFIIPESFSNTVSLLRECPGIPKNSQ